MEGVLRYKTERDVVKGFGSPCSAGIDLALPEETIIYPGEPTFVDFGVSVEIPEGCFGMLVVRSSLGFKKGIGLANQVGIIDSDYRGSIKACLVKTWGGREILTSGTRVLQLIILPYVALSLMKTDTLSDTERGEGGIGSTGT